METHHFSEPVRVRMDSAGRVLIPAEFREKMEFEPGHELILSSDGSGLRLRTFKQAVKEAQEALAPYWTNKESIVDELIRERREEAKREYGE